MRLCAVLGLGVGLVACGRTGLDALNLGQGRGTSGADAGTAGDAAPDAGTRSAADAACRWQFAPRVGYAAGPAPVAIAIGDLDGDGHPDLAVSNYAGGAGGLTLSTLRNLGNGSFAAWKSYASSVAFSLVTGSFMGNAANDVLAGCDLFANQGTGDLASPITYGTFCGFQDSFNNLAAADFDGDGRLDFAWAKGNMVGVFLQRGGGIFDEVDTTLTSITPYSVTMASADFDGDGRPDLVVAGRGYGNPTFIKILRNTGNGSFSPSDVGWTFSYPGISAADDLDGDGRPDLVVMDDIDGLLVLLNNGDGTWAAPEKYGTAFEARSMALGDLDGDGASDMVLADYGANMLRVSINNGDGTFAPQVEWPVSSGPYSVRLGDLNGDGHLDVAVASTDAWGPNEVSVFLSQCR